MVGITFDASDMGNLVTTACQVIQAGVRLILSHAVQNEALVSWLLTAIGQWLIQKVEAPTEQDVRKGLDVIDKAHDPGTMAKYITAARELFHIEQQKSAIEQSMHPDDLAQAKKFLEIPNPDA